jgi:hypothetical protein
MAIRLIIAYSPDCYSVRYEIHEHRVCAHCSRSNVLGIVEKNRPVLKLRCRILNTVPLWNNHTMHILKQNNDRLVLMLSLVSCLSWCASLALPA